MQTDVLKFSESIRPIIGRNDIVTYKSNRIVTDMSVWKHVLLGSVKSTTTYPQPVGYRLRFCFYLPQSNLLGFSPG